MAVGLLTPMADDALATNVRRPAVRFAAAFTANVVRAVVSFASGIVVARALGAASYGDLSFLLASFVAIIPLLDAGTSSAFFTFLSRQPRGRRFFAVFAVWMVVQALVPLAVIVIALPDRVVDAVWLGQPREVVFLAFASAFLTTHVWGVVSRMGEARRLTVRVHVAGAIQAVGHLVLVSAAAAMGWLTVNRTILLLVIEFAALCVLLIPRLLRENLPRVPEEESWRDVVGEFWKYCRPLVIYSWVGVPYAFADRWMLQAFAGSVQQGFFSLGSQFASVSLLATSSILAVFWKEIVDAMTQRNNDRVRALYGRVTRSLYFLGAWLSSALIPYSGDILRWTVGSAYASGAMVLALLLLYPVHQSLGQIQGTFFYASEDTHTYATIGIVMMVVSIPLTYLLLAPPVASFPGAGLGAIGLALKMVVLQLIVVNVQAWFIARRHGWKLDISHQVASLVGLLALSWFLRFAAEALLRLTVREAPAPAVAILGITGFVALSAFAVARWPTWVGVSREELDQWLAMGRARLARVARQAL